MITLRKSEERGLADHGWLKSRHTFSFADYHDKDFMGYRDLRVINEDRIQGGTGFGTHGHRDMEIISYVVEGSLAHKDSMGTEAIIEPGEIQRMSAGTGVRHSEQNHSPTQTTHFLQIWIQPKKSGLAPSYGQKSFAQEFAKGDLVLVLSPDGRDGSIELNQDAQVYALKSPLAGTKNMATDLNRYFWLQIIRGEISANGQNLIAGDGGSFDKIENLSLSWTAGSEFLLFNLP